MKVVEKRQNEWYRVRMNDNKHLYTMVVKVKSNVNVKS